MADQIPTALAAVEAALADLFSLPNNLGIRLRRLVLPTEPVTQLVALFVHGMADEDLVRSLVIEPVEQAAAQEGAPRLLPDDMMALLPAPRVTRSRSISATVAAVLDGVTALFFDRSGEAVLVGTERRPKAAIPLAGVAPNEAFVSNMADSIVLLRTRVRDPRLVAEPLPPPKPAVADPPDTLGWQRRQPAPGICLVYLKGRAAPELLDRIRQWVDRRVSEARVQLGRSTGLAAAFGLLPEVMTTGWADQAAPMISAGYVAILVDQVPYACVAPVTASALMYSPDDETLARPIATVTRFTRLLLFALIVLGPAMVVALLSYHQEMIPTPLLLAVSASRMSLPLPIVATVVTLELYQEMVRIAANKLPAFLPAGSAIVGAKVLILIMIMAGIVGPLPAVVSVLVQYATFGLPSYDALYMARIWRFWLIAGAGIFGLAGMATISFLLAAYMSQADSFGVPFGGADGLCMVPTGQSPGKGKGGNLCAPGASR
ncbi:MAG: spore germination protein [Mycobacterium leprae]